ncbi:galactose mutarotase [Actinocrinis puniceicyclus]|uniref:Aldose 1-epimerase n=1 Tax=Actinocrinis puniceicyclus TaxID=977794 RepID=A0A8J7WKU6_9ACTN|nr:aldose epimerase family protein [Actinocrinis puniceicyclus]MBS2964151.1 galactose mutarotase [Actinocrinis puniceicyclus]
MSASSAAPASASAPVRDVFGTLPDGRQVDRWTFTDATGVTAAVLTYGAVIQSLTVPGPAGGARPPANVVLGYDNLADYVAGSYYFGCAVGRYANRIAGGRFRLDEREYTLPVNDPGRPNALHGGPDGFHRRIWQARPLAEAGRAGVELSLVSEDGDQGYPGRLEAGVRYMLADGALHIDYQAVTQAPTVVNLTNHSFFNLSGEGSGTIDEHVLTLAASAYLPVDENLIPLASALPVDGTPFDFTAGAALGARLDDPHPQLQGARGYDHCYVLDGGRTGEPRPIGTLADPASGRAMQLLTTEPGIQLYTANALPADVVGNSGRNYGPRAAVALETQHFPDSPNRPDYPSTVLLPGQTYRSTTVLRFTHLR